MRKVKWMQKASMEELSAECICAELVLYMLEQLEDCKCPKNGYLHLRNWNQLCQVKLGVIDKRLAHLRSYLGIHYSHKDWETALNAYKAWKQGIYCFDTFIEDGKYKRFFYRKETLAQLEKKRLADYEDLLSKPVSSPKKELVWAAQSENELDYVDDYNRSYCFDSTIPIPNFDVEDKMAEIPICYSQEELFNAARLLDRFEQKPYRVEILKKTRLLEGKTQDNCFEFILQQVTNLIGQVGAGKSTFADALAVCIAQKGGKVLFLVNSIADAYKKKKCLKRVEFLPLLCLAAQERLENAMRKKIVTVMAKWTQRCQSLCKQVAVWKRFCRNMTIQLTLEKNPATVYIVPMKENESYARFTIAVLPLHENRSFIKQILLLLQLVRLPALG